MASDTKKEKALDLAINQIDRQFGKGAIMRMGDDHVSISDNIIPTGCLSLDVALGVGGVPKGRIIEIFGPESSGKTTLTLHIVAEAQKAGGYAAFIDAEHALDPEYAKNLGVNLDELLVSQPDSGEQSLEITETLAMRMLAGKIYRKVLFTGHCGQDSVRLLEPPNSIAP